LELVVAEWEGGAVVGLASLFGGAAGEDISGAVGRCYRLFALKKFRAKGLEAGSEMLYGEGYAAAGRIEESIARFGTGL
jgi:hypothetical protein